MPPGASESTTFPVQIIGSYNVFETDCTCEAFKIGDNNILESKGTIMYMILKYYLFCTCFYYTDIFIAAFVGREVELTNGCVIGAACTLNESETIPENTVIYGSACQRREMHDKPYVSTKISIYLMKLH